jgi:hypothetical protein
MIVGIGGRESLEPLGIRKDKSSFGYWYHTMLMEKRVELTHCQRCQDR